MKKVLVLVLIGILIWSPMSQAFAGKPSKDPTPEISFVGDWPSELESDKAQLLEFTIPFSGTGRWVYSINGNVEELGTMTYETNATLEINFTMGENDALVVVEFFDASKRREKLLDSFSDVITAAPSLTPLAMDDTANTPVNTPVNIDVLANDVNVDAGTIDVTTQPDNGSVSEGVDSLIYTPDSGYTGTDQFGYTVTTGEGTSNIGIVTITVESVDPQPVANDDTATTTVNTSVDIYVLDNDDHAVGGQIVVTKLPQYGTVLSGDDFLTYAPNLDYTGPDTFQYTVETDGGVSNVARVNILVNSIVSNTPPVAVDDTHDVVEDSPRSEVIVLENDIDLDQDVLEVIAINTPLDFEGLVELISGKIYYTPAPDFSGIESFTYTISDGTDTDTGSVQVNVERHFLYVALGDSIPYGSYVERGWFGIPTERQNSTGNYAQLLSNAIIPDEFRNVAESGLNTWEVLDQLDEVSGDSAVIDYVSKANLITLCVGANDIMDAAGRSYSEGLQKYNINWLTADLGREAFEDDWPALIDRIETLNPNVTIIVMTVYNPYHIDETDISGKTYEQVDAYFESTDGIDPGLNHVIRNVTSIHSDLFASTFDYRVADVYSAFKNYDDGNPNTINDADLLTNFYDDDLCDPHPTQLGHEVIFQLHFSKY